MEQKHLVTIIMELDRRLKDISMITEEKGEGSYFQEIAEAREAALGAHGNSIRLADDIKKLREQF